MENGPDRRFHRSSGDRRQTVSGALPHISKGEDESPTASAPSDPMRFPWSSTVSSSPSSATSSSVAHAPASPTKTGRHKRSLSGNILTRFSFLRTAIDDEEQRSRGEGQADFQSWKSRKSIDDDEDDDEAQLSSGRGEGVLAAALKPAKTRKRKGSLRKTALLGGRRQFTEGRERKSSLRQRSPSLKQSPEHSTENLSPTTPSMEPANLSVNLSNHSHGPGGMETQTSLERQPSYESTGGVSSSDSTWSQPAIAQAAGLSPLSTSLQIPPAGDEGVNELSSPLDLKTPTRQSSYASTTDDDDVLTFDRPVANHYTAQSREGSSSSVSLKKSLSSTANGYFPSGVSFASEPRSSSYRRRSTKQLAARPSPLSRSMTTLSSFPDHHHPEHHPMHDNTETEYWGWVILFVTWLTFTVGMGSCFEIWTWAWDVGETPYAPPELENDSTLPIVGYYPALIVLTGVVAWVWITVAWVGMKYFRHAKIEV